MLYMMFIDVYVIYVDDDLIVSGKDEMVVRMREKWYKIAAINTRYVQIQVYKLE